MSNTQTQPTPEQIVVARFEAVKVATAVAERVLLDNYERQIIIQACALALQTLQQEHQRLTAQSEDDQCQDDQCENEQCENSSQEAEDSAQEDVE